MKLYFMKDEAVTYFKYNVESHLPHYLDKDNRWMLDAYASLKGDDASPFGEFKLEVPDFKLDISNENPARSDYNNVKLLYTALKGISDTQASDERFWTGLAHSTEFLEYMQYRCQLTSDSIQSNKVLTNFFFIYGQKRSLLVNPLARLWWVGRLIYDDTAQDPFEALSYFKIDFAAKVLTLFSSNFTNNPKTSRAILKAIAAIEKADLTIGRKEYFEIIRYVNLLGGILILDYLSEEELKAKIIKHYYEENNVAQPQADESTAETLFSVK